MPTWTPLAPLRAASRPATCVDFWVILSCLVGRDVLEATATSDDVSRPTRAPTKRFVAGAEGAGSSGGGHQCPEGVP